MLEIFPDYYKNFRCKAGNCRHSCCIGWEIDIDEDSFEIYSSIGGEMGERLRENIDTEGEIPRFILGRDERCPFLNKDGLCDLIISGGEDMLCDICAEHPRWRSYLPGRVETGLGLCCEAAAELIILKREPVSLVAYGDDEEEPEDAAALIALRDEGLRILTDRSQPLEERCRTLLERCGTELPQMNGEKLFELLCGLERLDEGWSQRLRPLQGLGAEQVAEFKTYMQDSETEYEQLAVYFFLRHFLNAYEEGNAPDRAAFAVFCTQALWLLGAGLYAQSGSLATEDRLELCRAFSAEVEYSAENMETLLGYLHKMNN